MVASGQLPQAIDPSPLYTNDLLDQINAFDAKSVTTGQAPTGSSIVMDDGSVRSHPSILEAPCSRSFI